MLHREHAPRTSTVPIILGAALVTKSGNSQEGNMRSFIQLTMKTEGRGRRKEKTKYAVALRYHISVIVMVRRRRTENRKTRNNHIPKTG